MSVICKFQIESKTKTMGIAPNGDNDMVPQYKITARVVYDGSEENKKFFLFTPFGTLEMGTLNKLAADQFEPGDFVYVTIEKAPK